MELWICAYRSPFSLPCICATEPSTGGGIRAAGDPCLPFIMAHKHSGIFLERSSLPLSIHIAHTDRSEGLNPAT